jgi:hypothetical protein
MNHASAGELPAAEKWTTRYEELRRQILAEPEGGGWGRALLRHRGLVAWMQAWPSDDHAAHEEAAKPAASSAAATTLPAGLSRELTRVLVNMILDQGKELVS